MQLDPAMTLFTLPTVVVLSVWSLFSGVVAESEFLEDTCLSPVVGDAVQACGWTGSCSTCEDLCIPRAEPTFEAVGQLLEEVSWRKRVPGLQCWLLASLVNSGAGLASPLRKVLGTDGSGAERVQAAAEPLKHLFKSVAGKGLYGRSYKQRRLHDADTMSSPVPSVGCPNGTYVDAAATFLEEWYAERTDESGQAKDSDEEVVIHLVRPYIGEPEKLKIFLEESCFTENVTSTSNPQLFEIYELLYIGQYDDYDNANDDMDSTTASETTDTETTEELTNVTISAPVLSALTVCRPVGLEEETAVELVEAVTTSCGPDVTTVENGQCMSYTVSDLLAPACFNAGSDALGATTEQTDDLRAALLNIMSKCSEATSQADCEGLSVAVDETEVSRVVSEILAAAKVATNTTGLDFETDTAGADTDDADTAGADTADTDAADADTTGADTTGTDTAATDTSAVNNKTSVSMAETPQHGMPVAIITGFITLLAALM